MTIFEATLFLLAVAAILLQMSRKLKTPYPSMLALAGACFAAIPWAPKLTIDPRLSLVLFVAPALLDSACDTAPRELKRNWLPLLSLIVFAVILTTAAVAWAARDILGVSIAAAITLGAIVAPPDAAAASAVLSQFNLPRRTLNILQGESLLNDAVTLLIFGAASSAATLGRASLAGSASMLLIAVPGGALFGIVAAKLYLRVAPKFAGTLSSSISEFGTTFGVWIIAEHLHISPIISVVAYAMTVARYTPARQSPRDRVHSYSVWQAVVFVLNVLAFLLMGLQARMILSRLGSHWLRPLMFASVVLAIVIATRAIWVMTHWAIVRWWHRDTPSAHPVNNAILISWCGMRGLVTLATAFALPQNFPARDEIVLSAFAVVLGTLILQGLTLRPLINSLQIQPDLSLNKELSVARSAMLDAALATLEPEGTDAASCVKAEYRSARSLAENLRCPLTETEHDRLRMKALAAQRSVLVGLRGSGRIEDDTFHVLEEELDWSELAAAPPRSIRNLEHIADCFTTHLPRPTTDFFMRNENRSIGETCPMRNGFKVPDKSHDGERHSGGE